MLKKYTFIIFIYETKVLTEFTVKAKDMKAAKAEFLKKYQDPVTKALPCKVCRIVDETVERGKLVICKKVGGKTKHKTFDTPNVGIKAPYTFLLGFMKEIPTDVIDFLCNASIGDYKFFSDFEIYCVSSFDDLKGHKTK